jgi:hypothetical protein
VLCGAGLFFLLAGIGFDLAIAQGHRIENVRFWFIIGFFGLIALAGACLILWAAVELIRRFEIRLYEDCLRRVTIVGIFRWQRTWPLHNLAGMTLRETNVMRSDGVPYLNLQLVFIDGNYVCLFPRRCGARLAIANEELR